MTDNQCERPCCAEYRETKYDRAKRTWDEIQRPTGFSREVAQRIADEQQRLREQAERARALRYWCP